MQNLLTVGYLMTKAALHRPGSVGTHWRSDGASASAETGPCRMVWNIDAEAPGIVPVTGAEAAMAVPAADAGDRP